MKPTDVLGTVLLAVLGVLALGALVLSNSAPMGT